jgi:hypothetical protein
LRLSHLLAFSAGERLEVIPLEDDESGETIMGGGGAAEEGGGGGTEVILRGLLKWMPPVIQARTKLVFGLILQPLQFLTRYYYS